METNKYYIPELGKVDPDQLGICIYPLEGEKVLLECLQKDPSFAPALDALAGLAVRRGDCVRARELCAQALAIDTYDPAANYLDGLASDAQGLAAESHDRLYMAASSPLYRTAALARLAKMAMRREDWSAADELAKKSMQSNNFNFDAWLVRIAAARKRGDARAARRISDLALQVFPLFHGARFESKMLGDIDEDGFRSGVRNEFPDQTYMELGTWYENAGLFAEAKELFGYASNPLAKIRMAWMLGRSGMDSATASKALDAAAASSVAFVLPFRRETLPALEWAVSANPSWKFRYLLALHRAASGRNEDADRLLDTCDDADEAVVFLYRATRRNGAARLHDLMKAQSLDDGWRVGCGLAEHYRKEGNSSAAAEIAIGYLGRFPGNNELEFLYTRSLCELERYEEAANFLKTMRVLPSEHGRNAHDIWCTAWKGIARQALEAGDVKKADEALARYREYPENLGLGKPFPPDR